MTKALAIHAMKHFSRTLAVLATTMVVAACGAQEPSMNENPAREQFQQLMQRPDIDQAAARYEEMYRKVRQVLSRPPLGSDWKQTGEPGRAGCGSEFGAINVDGRSDAEHRGLGTWTAEGAVPENEWSQAVSRVRQVVQGYGFNAGHDIVASKGDHEIVFRDQYAAELNFGTAVNTTLLLMTGCHLTAAAKQRGSLAPLPSH